MYFKDVKIDKLFVYNGNLWRKRSTKTALMMKYKKVFYMGQLDVVRVLKND